MAVTLRQSPGLEHFVNEGMLFSADDDAADEDMLNFGFDFSNNNVLDNSSNISYSNSTG